MNNDYWIVNTRPADRAGHLSQLLLAQGFLVKLWPQMVLVQLPVEGYPELEPYSHILCSSPQIWDFVRDWARDQHSHLLKKKFICIGEKSSKATLSRGYETEDWGYAVPNVSVLENLLCKRKEEIKRVLHLCSLETRLNADVFAEKCGVIVDNYPVYKPELLPPSPDIKDWLNTLAIPVKGVVFFSGSAVRSFNENIKNLGLSFPGAAFFCNGLSALEECRQLFPDSEALLASSTNDVEMTNYVANYFRAKGLAQ